MTFWTDATIADDFTPEDKYFYLYLFTNPHTNLCGCYEISRKQMALETGYSPDTINQLLDRFEKVHKVIRLSSNTKELLIINWHKYNWTNSEKFRKPLLNQINSIKNKDFKDFLTDLFNGKDTVSIPYPYGIDTTVTVTDTVTDTKESITKEKKSKFPPTLEEIKTYCQERGNYVDAQAFMDFYDSKGWMIGKNKMKDWKAAVRTWERKDKEKGLINKPQKKTNEDTDKIFDLSEQENAPYFGFPKEWFDGETIVKERVKPVIRPRDTKRGWYEEETVDANELIEIYEVRRRYANRE